jgi:hypothetical protein
MSAALSDLTAGTGGSHSADVTVDSITDTVARPHETAEDGDYEAVALPDKMVAVTADRRHDSKRAQ